MLMPCHAAAALCRFDFDAIRLFCHYARLLTPPSLPLPDIAAAMPFAPYFFIDRC